MATAASSSLPSISRALARKLRSAGVVSSLHSDRPLLPRSPSSSFCSSASVIDSEPASPAPAQGRENGGRWSKWLLFLPGVVTFGLGTWQIFRRQDKIEMLEYRRKRLDMEPLKINDVSPTTENLSSLEFRRVVFRGFFDEGRSIFVGPRSRSISGVTENGYYLVTPLMPIPNDPESVKSPVLVNRGWVPRSWRDKFLETSDIADEPTGTSQSSVQDSVRYSWWKLWLKKPKIVEEHVAAVAPVEFIGVIRGSEKPSIFVPANDPSSSQWFYVDTAAIARAAGLPADTLYIEDINENVNPSNPYPVPKDVNTLIRSSVMPQDHLNYTMTWYSLSAAVTFMAFKRLRQKKSWR